MHDDQGLTVSRGPIVQHDASGKIDSGRLLRYTEGMHTDPLLDQAIRKVPNFPHEGILFYDITGILASPPAFAHVIDTLKNLYSGKGLGAVAAVESRGFVFAAPLAHHL